MPADLAARMPRSERIDERHEMLYVDGRSFKRRLQWNPELTEEDLIAAGQVARGREPGMRALDFFLRPPGAWDVALRLEDLYGEGIWAEIVYPSLGLWTGLIKDPHLYREGVKVFNDWLKETFLDVTDRCVPAAEISTLSVEDAVAEATRAEMGFRRSTSRRCSTATSSRTGTTTSGNRCGRRPRKRDWCWPPTSVRKPRIRRARAIRSSAVPAARWSTTSRPATAASVSRRYSWPRACSIGTRSCGSVGGAWLPFVYDE
jgi:hypothetical protein